MDSSGGSSGQTSYTISPEQRKAITAVMDYAKPALSARPSTEQYSGQMVASTPQGFYDAYDKFTGGAYSDLSDQATRDLISGKPAYEFDEAATTERWKSTYAEPVMEAWRESVAPIVKEGYNAPGTLWSRSAGAGMERASSGFYGSQVAPTLFSALQTGEQMGFQSGEAAAGRQQGALGIPYAQFLQQAGASGMLQQQEQAGLSAAYQEYMRTDPYRYAQLISGTATSPTQETAYQQGTDYTGAAMTAGMMLLMSDINVKENFEATDNALDKISKIKAFKYNYKGNSEKTSGVMAQHVEEVMPEAVTEVNGTKHLKIEALMGLVIDGINELREDIKNGNCNTSS